MTLQLTSGQEFAAHYTLLERVGGPDRVENWLALDTELAERVLLRIFAEPLSDEDRHSVESSIRAARGLVHPGIARLYALERDLSGHDAIAGQFVRGARPFTPGRGSLDTDWQVLDQLFDAVSFAHGLGLAHGNLHPGNILLDEQDTLRISDFGLPASLQSDDRFDEFLSPQIKGGARPDITDDVYSIGQMLFTCLTGRKWREGDDFSSTSPIPGEIRETVERMLSGTAYERPTDLSSVRHTFKRYVEGEPDTPLDELSHFSRARAATAPASTQGERTVAHRSPRERNVVSAPVAYGGLIALIVIGIAVFLILPSMEPASTPSTTRANTESTSRNAAPPTSNVAQDASKPEQTPLELARMKQFEADGEAIASEILRLQVELEDVGVTLWAGKRFNSAVTGTQEADSAYRDERYEQALAIYRDAKDKLTALKEQIEPTLNDNLARGERALTAGNSSEAIKAYTIATAIDPDNETAKTQLERAEDLDEVMDLVEQGEYLEREGRLQDARETLTSAVDIDDKWRPAIDALARVESKIATRRFNDAMSEGMTALAQDDFEAARAAFSRAQTILPESGEPADGIEQVEVAIRQNNINAHLDRATTHVEAEEWEAASSAYEDALDIDPTLVAANKGLETAKRRLELDGILMSYVQSPTQLSSNEELAKAKRILVEASRAEHQGPRLKRQIDQLSQHISLARIPMEVELKSDNRTHITVYKVRELGRLDSVSLELIPGSYTIVGERRGYRDVRHELTLIGGQPVDPIYISCTEKI